MLCNKNVEIYFVRHGQSWGNIEETPSFDYEKENPPLTSLGEKQAEKLLSYFEKITPDTIYASPLVRTVQTAYPVARKLGRRIEILPALVEKSTRTEGTDEETLSRDYPLAFFTKETDSDALERPFAHEEPVQADERAKRVVRYILSRAKNGEKILIAGHGTFYSYMMRQFLEIPLSSSFRWKIDNCSVTVIRFYENEAQKLCYMNDVRHLDENEIT